MDSPVLPKILATTYIGGLLASLVAMGFFSGWPLMAFFFIVFLLPILTYEKANSKIAWVVVFVLCQGAILWFWPSGERVLIENLSMLLGIGAAAVLSAVLFIVGVGVFDASIQFWNKLVEIFDRLVKPYKNGPQI